MKKAWPKDHTTNWTSVLSLSTHAIHKLLKSSDAPISYMMVYTWEFYKGDHTFLKKCKGSNTTNNINC